MENLNYITGRQTTEAKVVQFYVLNKYCYSKKELSECLGIPYESTERYIFWVERFINKNLFYEYIHEHLNINDDSLFILIWYVLVKYGNTFIRKKFRIIDLSWDNIAEDAKEFKKIQCKIFNGAYVKEIFEGLYNYREKLIEQCLREYDKVVVEILVNSRVDFLNSYEVGYLIGRLDVKRDVIREINVNKISKRYTEDDISLLYPNEELKLKIQENKEALSNMLKKLKSYDKIEKYVDDLLVGVAIINETSLEDVYAFLREAIE